MKRQELIDSLLINDTTKNFEDLKLQIGSKLTIRNSFRSEAVEWEDINDFVKDTTKWKVEKLLTPFGECKLIIDRDNCIEWREYQRKEGGMREGFILI